jgi:hypothetical protein
MFATESMIKQHAHVHAHMCIRTHALSMELESLAMLPQPVFNGGTLPKILLSCILSAALTPLTRICQWPSCIGILQLLAEQVPIHIAWLSVWWARRVGGRRAAFLSSPSRGREELNQEGRGGELAANVDRGEGGEEEGVGDGGGSGLLMVSQAVAILVFAAAGLGYVTVSLCLPFQKFPMHIFPGKWIHEWMK